MRHTSINSNRNSYSPTTIPSRYVRDSVPYFVGFELGQTVWKTGQIENETWVAVELQSLRLTSARPGFPNNNNTTQFIAVYCWNLHSSNQFIHSFVRFGWFDSLIWTRAKSIVFDIDARFDQVEENSLIMWCHLKRTYDSITLTRWYIIFLWWLPTPTISSTDFDFVM